MTTPSRARASRAWEPSHTWRSRSTIECSWTRSRRRSSPARPRTGPPDDQRRLKHRNASLSGAGRVRAGRLVCGYHGWSLDAQGAGRCLSQPSLRNCDTESFQVIERFGYLWLADRNVPEDALPVLGWHGFPLAGSLSHLFECPLRIALDNFPEA